MRKEKILGKTSCPGCGYSTILTGNLGDNWLSHTWGCSQCGTPVTIKRITAKDKDVVEFKKQLCAVKTIDDFLDL